MNATHVISYRCASAAVVGGVREPSLDQRWVKYGYIRLGRGWGDRRRASLGQKKYNTFAG